MFFKQKQEVLSLEQLNAIDRLYIKEFAMKSKEEQVKAVNRLIDKLDQDFIVKISSHDPVFYKVCIQPEFSTDWLCWWSSYGVVLSGGDKSKAFFEQKTNNQFDMFLGIYYFHKSVVIERQLGKPESSLQLGFLKRAMSYNCIHAYQQFHCYLYQRSEKKEKHFKLIIDNIKKLLPNYGAYAYLMLCEAYLRYGLFLNTKGDAKGANAFDAAIKACQYADKSYSKDDPVIHNASLGGTISFSNSYSLDDFEVIQTLIKDSYHLSEDTIKVPKSLSHNSEKTMAC